MSETFLYLTTRGRKSGRPHQIEIWYVEHEGCYYLVSEKRDKADWVRNILANPKLTFSIGTREDPQSCLPLRSGVGRILEEEASPLVAAVRRAMQTKYHWSDGLIVQLSAAEA